MSDYPAVKAMNLAARCGARNRAGGRCAAPAMRGRRRCRLHGGKATGAPKGNQNAYRHGLRSGDYLRARKLIREMRAALVSG